MVNGCFPAFLRKKQTQAESENGSIYVIYLLRSHSIKWIRQNIHPPASKQEASTAQNHPQGRIRCFLLMFLVV